MQKILLDTCGWVAIVDSGIHLDLELSKLVGNFELMLIESVNDEIKEYNGYLLKDLKPSDKINLIFSIIL